LLKNEIKKPSLSAEVYEGGEGERLERVLLSEGLLLFGDLSTMKILKVDMIKIGTADCSIIIKSKRGRSTTSEGFQFLIYY